MGAIYSVMSGAGAKATLHTVHAKDSADAAYRVGAIAGDSKTIPPDHLVSSLPAGETASNEHVKSNESDGVHVLSPRARDEELKRHIRSLLRR